jgi:hypothetical protein
MRSSKLEASNHEITFWNHLKEGILERQKRENAEIARMTSNVTEMNAEMAQIEKNVLLEVDSCKHAEEEQESVNNSKRSVKFKNLTNRSSKTDPSFNFAQKTLKLSLEKGKELHEFELKYLPEKQKYIPINEMHPKAAALVSQFNFHRSISRLKEELTEFVNIL